eukprot:3977322-Prymnesium_polylepis.1
MSSFLIAGLVIKQVGAHRTAYCSSLSPAPAPCARRPAPTLAPPGVTRHTAAGQHLDPIRRHNNCPSPPAHQLPTTTTMR